MYLPRTTDKHGDAEHMLRRWKVMRRRAEVALVSV